MTNYIQFNPKCVYFSVFLIIAYLGLPEGRVDVALMVFATFFLLTMLYHEVYLCDYPQGIHTLIVNVVFSTFITIGYLYLTKRKNSKSIVVVSAFFIFVFGYIGMAVYDDLYGCKDVLRHGFLSFTHLFKPKSMRLIE